MLRLLTVLLFISCSSAPQKYPFHWWEKVPSKSVKSWEIPPSAADPANNEVILSKRNELGILSNFSHTPFELEGKSYESVEGFWQSLKYSEGDKRYGNDKLNNTREEVEKMIAFDAKSSGDEASKLMKKYNINWVTYKNKKMTYRISEKGEHYKLIKRAMLAKLNQNKKVQEVLLKTGDLVLRPDHHTQITDPPAWKYYLIWMELRDKLRGKID